MSLAKKGRLGDHSFPHGFDTSEHGFYTEVLTPTITSRLLIDGKYSTVSLPAKERILILANKKKESPNKPKRSFKTITTKEYYQYGDLRFAINSRKSGCYTQILNLCFVISVFSQMVFS